MDDKLRKKQNFFYPLLLGFDLSRQVVDIVIGHSGWPDRVLCLKKNNQGD